METKFKLAMYATIVALCLATQSASAQLQTNTNMSTGDTWTQVDPSFSAQSIGIGDFDGNNVVPQAALHINTNSGYLPASPTFSAGEVFRTDAPNAATYWKMYRGGTEYGRIYNNNDNHFYIQASDAGGDLRFNASGGNTYMTIAGSGNVGIGTTTPAHTLQVNGTVAAKQILIEDKTETKDLLALITQLQSEVVELKQQMLAFSKN